MVKIAIFYKILYKNPPAPSHSIPSRPNNTFPKKKSHFPSSPPSLNNPITKSPPPHGEGPIFYPNSYHHTCPFLFPPALFTDILPPIFRRRYFQKITKSRRKFALFSYPTQLAVYAMVVCVCQSRTTACFIRYSFI